ncbi:MAG TPA: YciI family protein [Solirubrobacterales bacterium]|nr:YciI family protein [Solirubrobacterales bacterium]
MKVMVLVKANEASEAGEMPSEEMLTQMGAYNEELVNAGIMLAGDGLHPSVKGARVNFHADGGTTVTDGPFAETKELLAGYWVWQVKDMDEAIEWARRMPNPEAEGAESSVEIRPVFTEEDFGDALTPDLKAQEDELRRRVEEQQQ